MICVGEEPPSLGYLLVIILRFSDSEPGDHPQHQGYTYLFQQDPSSRILVCTGEPLMSCIEVTMAPGKL
jgi:hypothetical protein